MTLSDVLAIWPGDEFRFNGEWLEVMHREIAEPGIVFTVAGEPGARDRVFIADTTAKRRVRRHS